MALFNEVVDEVVALCGNRRDRWDLFASAVNQAVLALWNAHVGHAGSVVVDLDTATDTRVTFSNGVLRLDMYADMESVNGVAFSRTNGELVQLDSVNVLELLELPAQAVQEPLTWALEGNTTVVFIPKLVAPPSTIRVIGVPRPTYISPGGEIRLLPDSMRAAYVALAASIAKVYLGEPEHAQNLAVMSKLLSPREVGPAGKKDIVSNAGFRPVGGV